jgi:hypothetical protein
MVKKVTKLAVPTPPMNDLRGAYARATGAFNGASATLILAFGANLRPAE